ncbi:MAG: prolyl oligopeptidase family serine peptidase [Longimicrobiales bacterium]
MEPTSKRNLTACRLFLGAWCILAAVHAAGARPLGAQDAGRRAMTIDDWLGMVQVSSPLLTPDGRRVLYRRQVTNWEDNEIETSWWLASADGGRGRPFIGGTARDVRMSPDGLYVSFLRDEDDKAQVFVLPLEGGEARPLTDHDTAVQSHEWSGDGRYVVFLAAEPRREEDALDPDKGDDAVIVNEGANTRSLGRWRNLWRIEVGNGTSERVTDVQLHIFEFEVSPTGERVAFVARASGDQNDIDHNEIYVATTGEDEIRRLTDDRAVQDMLRWSPEGGRIAFKADDDRTWTAKRDRLWVLDLATQTSRAVAEAFTEGRINQFWWGPAGESLSFSALVRTDTNLFEVELESGLVEGRTAATGTLATNSLSADFSRIAFTFEDFDTPADVYVADLSPGVATGRAEGGSEPAGATRLTDSNPWIESELALASMEVIRWASGDGVEIEGLLHRPGGSPHNDLVPLMLNIHGGPAGFFNNVFSPAHHIYAGLGYASLSPNIRGSAGYSDALREGNTFYRGDGIGYGDFDDLMAGVDLLVREGVADPDRLALRGWSYGAILGGYTVTQTDRFRAAALGAGVYDWSAEYGMGYNWDVTRWYIGGRPWDNRERWMDQSTITHVENISTPLLLLHGMEDNTTTEPQSAILYQAVKDIGKAPVRWIRFPREPHGFREPRHNRTRYVEEIRWMERHVKGVEWTPWERPDPKTTR